MHVPPDESTQWDHADERSELDASRSNQPASDRTRRMLTSRPEEIQRAAKLLDHSINTGLCGTTRLDGGSLDGVEPVTSSKSVVDDDAIGSLDRSNGSPFDPPLEHEVPALKSGRARVDPRPSHGEPRQHSKLCDHHGEHASPELEARIGDHRGGDRGHDEDHDTHEAR